MKELKLGKMSTKEIAEWMGVAYSTFRKNSAERLKMLSYYADFEKVYGGVVIKDIYFSTFVKDYIIDDKNFIEEIKRCVESDVNNGMALLDGVTNKFIAEKEEYKELSFARVRTRVGKSAGRTFGGISKKGEINETGSEGYRRRKWGIKIDDYDNVRELTKEEMEIFKKIVDRYYKDSSDRIRRAELDDDFKNGFIDEESYWVEVNKDNFFPDIIRDFKRETKKNLILGTKYYFWKDKLNKIA